VFVIIIIILLAGLITLLILYLKQLSSVTMNNDKNKTDFENQKVSKIFDANVELSTNVCNSVQCVRSAAEILNSMDPSVDPCEDFYGFACNGWIQKHQIPKVIPIRKFPMQSKIIRSKQVKKLFLLYGVWQRVNRFVKRHISLANFTSFGKVWGRMFLVKLNGKFLHGAQSLVKSTPIADPIKLIFFLNE